MTTPWTRHVKIGDCDLYLGDCLEVMPALGKVDAVVTDPPYGIGYTGNGGKGWVNHNAKWDDERPQRKIFDVMRENSKNQIIWGGNYFSDLLPPTMQWLVWDKGQRDFSLADCEFAWSSQNKAARIFDYARAKAMRDGKQHPTQKPVALMQWCLCFLPDAKTILDPFMGSGTTLVACAKLGRKGIGIELDPDYFEIACKRVQAAYDQPDLFVAPPTPATQDGFDL
jgi:DNA modification methylase